MPQFIALPDEVAAVFGTASAKFVDFLNSSFSLQKEDVITVSANQFENRLVRETSEIRLEMAELRSETRTAIAEVHTEIADLRSETRTAIAEVRAEIAELRSETRTAIAEVRAEIAELRSETRTAIAEVRTEIAELRSEMKADFASIHKEIAGLHGQIAGIHREISLQTRWMLAGLAAAVTLYPIITKLLGRLLP